MDKKVESSVAGNETAGTASLSLKELCKVRNHLCPTVPFNLFYTVFYEHSFKLYNFHANCEVSWRSVNGGKRPFSSNDADGEADQLNAKLTDDELTSTSTSTSAFKLPMNQVFIFPQHFNRETLEAEHPWMTKRMRVGEWFEYGHRSEILCVSGVIEDQLHKAIKNTAIVRQQQMRRIISAMFAGRRDKIEEALTIVKGLSLYKDEWKFVESFYAVNAENPIHTSTGTFASSTFFLPHLAAASCKKGKFVFRLAWPITSPQNDSINSINSTCSLEEHINGEAKKCLPGLKLEEWELVQLLEWFYCCTYDIDRLHLAQRTNAYTNMVIRPEDSFADFGYPGGRFANQTFVSAVEVQPLLHRILATRLRKSEEVPTSESGMLRPIPTAVVDIIYGYHQLVCPSPFDYVKQ